MRFEFATATRILFGQGTIKECGLLVRPLGDRALLVLGKSGERISPLIEPLRESGIAISEFRVSGEPTVETIMAGLEHAQVEACNLVIGIGGGSVIDAGKAIAVLMTNPGPIHDYLEVVGSGKQLIHPSIPYIAIPTTAGAGSEVTRNSVITVAKKHVKVSLRSAWMLPRLAIVDPELTYSLPPEITAATGLDALTQLIEPFLSTAPNPMTDAICREGMRRVSRSLRSAYQDGDDPHAREDMAIGSLLGGMALANAKLGAVHGFASSIGGKFSAPHGAICARLLPLVVKNNLEAIQARAAQPTILGRFDEIARLLTGDPAARAEAGINWLFELGAALKVPPLATYGLARSDIPEIIVQAKSASSMKGNPIGLSDAELSRIVELAL